MNIKYIRQECKKILHKIDNPRLPFKWGLNPYRGCLHSCLYCYARYTHSYLNLDPESDFETTIFIKTNAAQILRKEFSKPSWKKENVNLGSVCDPYQPIEKKEEITKSILQEFLRYKNPLTIATKSGLILRDVKLLSELNSELRLNIVISVSTMKSQLQKQIEPRASTTTKRLEAISKLRDNGLNVGVLIMPIIPFLSDSYEELDNLFEQISNTDANYIIPGILYLIGSSKKRFLDFIKDKYPNLNSDFKELYTKKSPREIYKLKIHTYFKELAIKHNLSFHNNEKKALKQINQKSLDNWLQKRKKKYP